MIVSCKSPGPFSGRLTHIFHEFFLILYLMGLENSPNADCKTRRVLRWSTCEITLTHNLPREIESTKRIVHRQEAEKWPLEVYLSD